jgi:histidinol-phosphatase (PHP family)
MSILYDIHLHTSFSPDSTASLREQINSAINLGLKGICITDHMDYLFPVEECPGYDKNPFIFDVDKYFYEITNERKSHVNIEILKGIEIGLQTDTDVVNYNTRLVNNNDFDEVIGSIHLIDKKDPYYPAFWEEKKTKDLLKKYFEITLDNLNAFSDIDTLGHLDYATRYLPDVSVYDPKEYMEITDEIMRFLIKNDIAMEINTSGLKKGYGSTNPHPVLIKRYFELGGTLITIGSDAHSPYAVAFGFDKLSEELISYGFKEYTIFRSRKPIHLPL